MSQASDAILQKLRAERLAYAGVPTQSRWEIVEEAIGKLLALPEDQVVVNDGLALAEGAASMLITPFVGAPLSGLAIKGADLLLHALISHEVHVYQQGLAAGNAAP